MIFKSIDICDHTINICIYARDVISHTHLNNSHEFTKISVELKQYNHYNLHYRQYFTLFIFNSIDIYLKSEIVTYSKRSFFENVQKSFQMAISVVYV